MEISASLSAQIKKLDSYVRQVLRGVELAELSPKERKFTSDLQQNLIDARIYISGYELSETREEQLANAKPAKKWLSAATKNMLAASEYNIFGAIDIAQLSAQIEQIKDGLK